VTDASAAAMSSVAMMISRPVHLDVERIGVK
jgi:hypothetical protein